jgi:DNA-binding NarL/FixJ family response regulator
MPITVFLADDHAVFRDGLRFLLEAQGDIKVVGDAATGREAVRQVVELCPDVVVMDVTMPGLNGIEATRRVCEACPSIQVVVLSMHHGTEYVFQALRAGARGYLLKESAGIEVAEAIRAVLAGHRYLSQKLSDKVIEEYVRQREAVGEKGPLAGLSSREREILQLVVEGKSSVDIAAALSLSPKTIDTYRSRMMRKLGIKDVPTLVKFAILNGITPLE